MAQIYAPAPRQCADCGFTGAPLEDEDLGALCTSCYEPLPEQPPPPAGETPHNKTWDMSLPMQVSAVTQWAHHLAEDGDVGALETAGAQRLILDWQVYDLQLLNGAECAALIAEAEAVGFGRTTYPKAYRGNLRLVVTDAALAAALWRRLAPHVPAEHTDASGASWDAIGCNEVLRVARYSPGDEFGAHVDAAFVRSGEERSMYTVNAYLNGGFEGGATRFYDGDEEGDLMTAIHHGEVGEPAYAFAPRQGAACVFRQPPERHYLHDGERLRSGVKYLLRTDVMYRRRDGCAAGIDAGGGSAVAASPEHR